MAKRIITNQFRTHIANQLLESISEESNTSYYVFIGDHVAEGDTITEVDQPNLSIKQTNIDTYRNMIAGVRLNKEDMCLMIRHNLWEANTIYDRYDDRDIALMSKNFFVAVDEDSYIHVYKCIDNANKTPSLYAPQYSDVNASADGYYETADGYVWRYMYSVDSVTYDKFSSAKYMPVVANSGVTISAKPVNGSIQLIAIDEPGRFYNNYVLNRQFVASDFTGDFKIFALPSGSSQVTDYYANTIMHLTSGTGAGQYRKIVRSFSNNLGVYVEANAVFTVSPDITTTYEITPMVDIVGDGNETINAEARTIIDPNASNSVARIEILNPGEGYSFATATIFVGTQGANSGGLAGEIVEVEPAAIRPVLPPLGGHGSKPDVELGAKTVSFVSIFANTLGDIVNSENTFGQFGIVRDPLFANVELELIRPDTLTPGYNGQFIADEVIHQIDVKRLHGNVIVNAGNNTFVATTNDTDYENELSVGDCLYINSNADITYNAFGLVDSIVNSTAFTLNTNTNWSDANAQVYIASTTSLGTVNETTANTIFVKLCEPNFITNKLIIGETTFAVARINAIRCNNETRNFDAFNQMQKFIGTVSSIETFVPDELVYQANSGATARLHSVSNNNTLFVTQVTGEFDTSEEILGDTSLAVLSSGFDKYKGELDTTSGSIIYLQNDIPVERANNRTEQIRITLEF